MDTPGSRIDPDDLEARINAILDAHPHQPLVRGKDGQVRFFGNGVIGTLFDKHPQSLDDLLAMDFPREDKAQFVELLGLSCQEVDQMGLLGEDVAAPVNSGRKPRHPIQAVVDDNGMVRYRENKVVCYLMDTGPMDPNSLCMEDTATQPNWEQWAQLIGYSLDGAGNLRHMSTRVDQAAWRAWEERGGKREKLRAQLVAQALEGRLPTQDPRATATLGKPRL